MKTRLKEHSSNQHALNINKEQYASYIKMNKLGAQTMELTLSSGKRNIGKSLE